MKQNNLIVAGTTRTCTAEELDHLQHHLRKSASPRKRQLKAILNVFVLWGGALLGLLLASGVLSYFATHSEILASFLAFSGLQEIAITCSALYALFSTYRWLQGWENPYPLIAQDISDALVVEETYFVQDVCRFQEPELGGFIYFLKISEQAVFVVYDYQSQQDTNCLLTIQKQLTLTRAVHSELIIEHAFKGDDIPLSATYPLTIEPQNWPVADTWCAFSWSQLPSQLNPNDATVSAL